MAPWSLGKIIKEAEATEQLRLRNVRGRTIYVTAESLRNMGILLQAFIPDKAAHLLDVLGVSENNRTFEFLGLGKDFAYGKPLRDPGVSAHDGLFPPLAVET
jgi:methionyl-tRNA synthetase